MGEILTGTQCVKARKLLGWNMRELRMHSKVSIDAISRLERGRKLQARTLDDLRAAFEAARIVFEKGRPPRLQDFRPTTI